MPELAALERVAREIADWYTGYTGGPAGLGSGSSALADKVAAALAACAREEARFWAEEGGHVADGSSECIYCARLAERAAGEKGQSEAK